MKSWKLEEDVKELLKNELLNLVEAVQNGYHFYLEDIITFIFEYCGYNANGAYTMWTDECEDNVLQYIKEEGFEILHDLIENYGDKIIRNPHILEMVFLEMKGQEMISNITFKNIDPEEEITKPEQILAFINEINIELVLGIKFEG